MSFDQAQGLPSLLAAFDPIMHAKRKGVCEGDRSAEPPISQGIRSARTFSTLPDASRLATPLASAGKVGRSASHPSGSDRQSVVWGKSGSGRVDLGGRRV